MQRLEHVHYYKERNYIIACLLGKKSDYCKDFNLRWLDWCHNYLSDDWAWFCVKELPEDKRTERYQCFYWRKKKQMTLKVARTHQAGRRWYRSWLQDLPQCWLLPPHCSGSLGPDWESAQIRLSHQLYGWCGTYSRSPSTKSVITESKRKWKLRRCYEGFVATFNLVAATSLCFSNWLAQLLQHFSLLWILCYICEVEKHFTTRLYALQAVHRASTSWGSHNMSQCSLKPMKNKWGLVIISVTQFQERVSVVAPRKKTKSRPQGWPKPGPQTELNFHLSMSPEDLHMLNPRFCAFFSPHLLPSFSQVTHAHFLRCALHTVCVNVFALLCSNSKALNCSAYLKNGAECKCH